MRRLLATACSVAPLLAQAAGYVPQGRCGPWPRVLVPAAAGHCVALVAGAAQGLRYPRRLLALAPGRFWLVDMGSWEPRRGRLLELTLAGGQATLRVLADGLDRPHGIALGPDGLVYLAEAGRVSRWSTTAPGTPEPVWSGLPADGAHPLKEIVFAPDGRLFMSVGSATDACRNEQQQQPRPCPEVQGELPRAAVWEARLDGPGGRVGTVRVHARGLRNSLALAWDTRLGALWQGENSVDYPEAHQPPEELNLLRPGADHGWPYCLGARQAARGYPGHCRSSAAPQQLWPAHAAPLQLLWLPREAPGPWGGQLLAAWHGHRAVGRRVVGFALGAGGLPAQAPRLWFGGAAVPGQPVPAPVGITLDAAGTLYIVDDRNKAVLALLRDGA